MTTTNQQGYRRLYPGDESLVFDGGLDNKFERALLPENESPDCLNVEFINGSVTTRQGAVRINTLPAGTVAFDGLYTRRANDNSETMCAFIGGHMFTLAATTFITVPSAQSVFTIGQRVAAEMTENYLFIGNGGAGPYKWDGTRFTQHGVSAPVATCTTVSGVTGSLTTNGNYNYRVTHVNTALVESNLGPVSTTFTVSSAGLAIIVSNIPVGSAPSNGVNARYLYRNLANGSSYFRVTKLLDNTTTSFTDTVADTALGSPAPTDNGLPPLYNAILYHNGYLFTNDVNNPNFVWFSNAGTPYTFASTNFFKVGDKTSDLVKGFAAYDNSVIVFCEKSTWINFMSDPADSTTWRRIRSNSPYGSKSAYALVNCEVRGEDMILHPAVQNNVFVGFAGFSGLTVNPSVSFQTVTSAGSDLQSQTIEPDMLLVQAANTPGIGGIVYKNRAFFAVPYGVAQTTNNRVYVWDFSLSNLRKEQIASWVPWSGTGMSLNQFTIYLGKLYGASSTTNGFVYQIGDTGVYNDDGTAINSYWWSKEHAGFPEDSALTKDFRYLNALFDNAGNYYMNIVYRTDSDKSTGLSQQISLVSGSSVWGTGTNGLIWGIGMWGGGVSQTESRIYFGAAVRGKRLQFRFDNQNTVDQRFKIYRAQFLYNLRGYR